MIGINGNSRPHITEMLGVKPSSLTQWESSKGHGHEMIGEDRGLVNAANLAPSEEDMLNTVIDDMSSIRHLIVSRQTSSDMRKLQAAEKAELEKMLETLKANISRSTLESKTIGPRATFNEDRAGQQGNVMQLEDKILEDLGLNELNVDDPEIVEKLDASIEKVSQFTGEGKFDQLLKATKDKSDMVRAFKTSETKNKNAAI